MTPNRREAFEPEDLAILGSAFDQIWTIVDSELGDAGPERKGAARTRLANIKLQLAKHGQLDPEEIKGMAIRIFRSIEVRTAQPMDSRRFTCQQPMSTGTRGPI